MKNQIKPELYQKLMKLNDKKIGVDSFIKSVIHEGQKVMAEVSNEQRSIWEQIAKDTGIDLQNTDWAPSSEEPNTIVLIQQRFFGKS